MADSFPESIAEQRRSTIKRLLDTVYDLVDRYLNGDVTCRHWDTEPKACSAIILGSLLQGLKARHLWPRTDESNTYHCVKDCSANLSDMAIWLHRSVHRGEEHETCDPHLPELVSKALAASESPVLDSHRRHMEIQRG